MPPSSALHFASLGTTPNIFLSKTPLRNPPCTSLQPFRASLKYLLTTKTAPVFTPAAVNNSREELLKTPQLKSPGLQKRRASAVSSINSSAKDEEEEDEDDEEDEENGVLIAQGPDTSKPNPGLQFAEFAAGHFWYPELAFQRVLGVAYTEVGYSQGRVHNPSSNDVERGNSGHAEVVRILYDPEEVSYEDLLEHFWECHDPTALNRQGYHLGTQFRSGIYFYSPEQEKAARESLERQEKKLGRKIVTEILPAKKFYKAEDRHQQYLEWGRHRQYSQSAQKGCKDPILRKHVYSPAEFMESHRLQESKFKHFFLQG